MSPLEWGVATVLVAIGAVIQGTVGFGLGLFAAPLLLLIEPELVPGPLLLASGLLTALVARREWHAVRKQDLKWALSGRVVGTVLASAALLVLSADRVDLLFGTLVLAAVALTAIGLHVRPGPRVLLGVGTVSGFMGTLTSIGGPPIALVYQHETGPRIRGTLNAFFMVGVLLSIMGLAAVDRFGLPHLVLGVQLMPGIVLGFWLSRRTSTVLDEGLMRPAVLIVSTISALAVILK